MSAEQLSLLGDPTPQPALPVRSGAILSPCGKYRYHLMREWNATLPRTLFVMLNPSTADASLDDPTIRRCMGFARSWGSGGIEVVNLFALRATDPEALWDHLSCREDGINHDYVRGAVDRVLAMRGGVIVAAWGAHATAEHSIVQNFLRSVPVGTRVMCLGKTRKGAPKHPLYLAANTALETFADGTGPR